MHCIIVRKTQSSFTQYFAHDLFTHPSYQWMCCGLFLQSSEGFWISLHPSSVQLLQCLLSFVSQKFPKVAQSILNNFLLSIHLWKYLFLSTAYFGNLPSNCRSIYLSHVNNLKNYSFPGYLSTLDKPHSDVEWRSISWVYHLLHRAQTHGLHLPKRLCTHHTSSFSWPQEQTAEEDANGKGNLRNLALGNHGLKFGPGYQSLEICV